MPSDKAVVHVIDDDEAMRESLAFLLATAGIEVSRHTTPLWHSWTSRPASRQVASSPMSRMPGISGIELVAATAGAQARRASHRHHRSW